jgi:hypothetical protein
MNYKIMKYKDLTEQPILLYENKVFGSNFTIKLQFDYKKIKKTKAKTSIRFKMTKIH